MVVVEDWSALPFSARGVVIGMIGKDSSFTRRKENKTRRVELEKKKRENQEWLSTGRWQKAEGFICDNATRSLELDGNLNYE